MRPKDYLHKSNFTKNTDTFDSYNVGDEFVITKNHIKYEVNGSFIAGDTGKTAVVHKRYTSYNKAGALMNYDIRIKQGGFSLQVAYEMEDDYDYSEYY